MKSMYEKSRNAGMPGEHFEMKEGDLNVSNLKYASKDTMQNPEDLKRSNDALVGYVKKKQMKY